MTPQSEEIPQGYEPVRFLYEALPAIVFSQPSHVEFKAWLLPDGIVQPTNGFHFRWLQQNPSVAMRFGLTSSELAGDDEQPVRLAAVRKGFVRLHYARGSGLMTVEAVEAHWSLFRQFIVGLWIAKNLDSVDTVHVHLMASSGLLLHKKIAELFRAEQKSDRIELLPIAKPALEEIKRFLVDHETAGQPMLVNMKFWILPSGEIVSAPGGHGQWLQENRQAIEPFGLDLEGIGHESFSGDPDSDLCIAAFRAGLYRATIGNGNLKVEGLLSQWERYAVHGVCCIVRAIHGLRQIGIYLMEDSGTEVAKSRVEDVRSVPEAKKVYSIPFSEGGWMYRVLLPSGEGCDPDPETYRVHNAMWNAHF